MGVELGEPLRRYEHDHLASLIHVGVTKFANIPDGGGHRCVGRQQGGKNQRATPGISRGVDRKPRTGIAFLHTVIDDHSRLAYAEICADEKPPPQPGCCAARWPGTTNAASTLSESCQTTAPATARTFGATRAPSSASPTKRTRPCRPQTNGKIERFHCTLADGWAYARHYTSDAERRAALPGWLHFYKNHRIHSAIDGVPASRLNNLAGHHI